MFSVQAGTAWGGVGGDPGAFLFCPTEAGLSMAKQLGQGSACQEILLATSTPVSCTSPHPQLAPPSFTTIFLPPSLPAAVLLPSLLGGGGKFRLKRLPLLPGQEENLWV